MKKVVIQATKRDVTGKQVKALRREGKLPGVLYGHNFEATPISMDMHATTIALTGLSHSAIVNIVLDGQEKAALVREKQRNYIKNTLLHVDFQVVSLTEKIRTKVSIELEGVSPAVKDYNGVIVTNLDEVEVECLPQDLPERFVVDISKLERIGSSFSVADLAHSDAITIHADPTTIIAVVSTSGEEETTEETAAPAEPERVERAKKEEVA